MENRGQVLSATPQSQNTILQEKLTELLMIARETRETSGLVKIVFTQDKPKKTKQKVVKAHSFNEYLRKHNKSINYRDYKCTRYSTAYSFKMNRHNYFIHAK